MIPGLYAVMNVYKLDERTLIRFTDYYGKPLTQRKSLQPNLAGGSGLEDLSGDWNPRKADTTAPIARPKGLRWWGGHQR